jgi:hypothetical protein
MQLYGYVQNSDLCLSSVLIFYNLGICEKANMFCPTPCRLQFAGVKPLLNKLKLILQQHSQFHVPSFPNLFQKISAFQLFDPIRILIVPADVLDLRNLH